MMSSSPFIIGLLWLFFCGVYCDEAELTKSLLKQMYWQDNVTLPFNDKEFIRNPENVANYLRDFINATNVTTGQTIDGTESVLFRVIGLSSDCDIYIGWLHNILNSTNYNSTDNVSSFDYSGNSSSSNSSDNQLNSSHDVPYLRGNKYSKCTESKLAFIRTRGIKTTMAVVLEKSGNRVLVHHIASDIDNAQSAGDRFYYGNLADSSYEHFYSNPLPLAYNMHSVIAMMDRVFIIAFHENTGRLRLFELDVILLPDNTMVVYISGGGLSLPVALSTFNPRILSIEVASHLIKNNSANGTYETSEGLVFRNIESDKNGSRMTSLSCYGLMNGHYRTSSFDYKTDNYTMNSFFGDVQVKFSLYENKYFLSDLYISPYYVDYTPDSIVDFKRKAVPAHSVFLSLSTIRYFNPRNFHKRMVYPHTLHPSKERGFINLGWKNMGFFTACICVIYMLIVIMRYNPWASMERVCFRCGGGRAYHKVKIPVKKETATPEDKKSTKKSSSLNSISIPKQKEKE